MSSIMVWTSILYVERLPLNLHNPNTRWYRSSIDYTLHNCEGNFDIYSICSNSPGQRRIVRQDFHCKERSMSNSTLIIVIAFQLSNNRHRCLNLLLSSITSRRLRTCFGKLKKKQVFPTWSPSQLNETFWNIKWVWVLI